MKTILMIDDDELILESMKVVFTDLGYDITTISQPAEGIITATTRDFDLILTDVRMPGINGSEVVYKIREAKPQAKILVVTAYPGDPWAQKALDFGALALVKKPFEIIKILDYLKD